ncbi:hypothetical protein SUGI_0595580 [Cryptomeria japonica]|uniref:citrate-binding protein n=1 Tax=Cryptomeria japonica TaxID=3369 RepID=UPI0024148370|nr:citrate-binding protein [Cryptomeria japonica]GLJ30114.1 hypothetical protein SUGI_0595580 [Cryptomeria japonica]
MEKSIFVGSIFFSCFILLQLPGSIAAPTDGFTAQDFTFDIQKPYDKSVDQRYTFINDVHTMWVFSNDKPHTPSSNTKPRTEMRFRAKGGDYTSGVWQFEGDMYVPSGSTGVAAMQVMGGANGVSAALQIRVYDGVLKEYGSSPATSFGPANIYDRWIHLNVIHDADNKHIQIYLDGKLSFDASNPGTGSHYFKCGVYTQNNSSQRMESRWRNIKIWKRN